ncbi:MAG: UDP-N-acetylmuramoyl-L-alanyl-D-glutamate--2,6-diaminopimelate ligase [Bradymonadaceae bacterium]
MKVSDIVERIEGIDRVRGDGDPALETVSYDSRQLGRRPLFVALEGETTDGHRFVGEAVDAGARAVLVERDRASELEVDAPVLVADGTREVLGRVADAVYGEPSGELTVVGVTGTDGKTTTAHLLRDLLASLGSRVGIVGTVANVWGDRRDSGPNTTPESARLHELLAAMRDDGVEVAVIEVSSHALVTHRVEAVRFDCGIFTNLGRDHLEFHGDLASYRRAKKRLFNEYLSRGTGRGRAVLNRGSEVGRDWAAQLDEHSSIDVRTFAVDSAADVSVRIVESTLDGVTLKVNSGGDVYRTFLPLVGEFNAENAAAAWAAARTMGADDAAIADALPNVEAPPGRLERVVAEVEDDSPSVFVDYAHTPDALDRVVTRLEHLSPGRLIVVFGCGGDRDEQKRPEMGRVVVESAQIAVVTSDNPRSESPRAIVDDVLEGMGGAAGGAVTDEAAHADVVVELDRGGAIEGAIAAAEPSDVVLIAGKGHEQYQEFADRTVAFDDRERAKRALERRADEAT